ncbi:MAG: hypothetical protein JOZ24_06935, partial [Candidatus Eremiobacteraeota bacterium]|nr:hypothetical protein [Candidatus Eremiobacteraeota bacterium]
MIRALVSLGTNSTRLLIVDGERRIAGESRGTRLGTRIGASGHIDPQARERTLAAVDEYVLLARAAGVEVVDAVATSVLRRASDGEDFVRAIAERVGVRPRILLGAEEAAYSFLGATRARPAQQLAGVLDVGGGSAELGIDVPREAQTQGRVAHVYSIEIGAVRLAERHPALLGARGLRCDERRALEREARDDAAEFLAPYADVPRIPTLIAVGGTVFTAALMQSAGEADGVVLTRADVAALIDALLARDLAARRAM